MKKLAALLGAGTLSIAMVGTVFAGVTVWATVDGHEAFSEDANAADYWGENCTKINTGEGDLGDDQATYVLGADYGKVVVKSGAGEFANTIFNDVSAGETVWADTNGNNVFDEAGPEGDQNISHIIFCDEAGDEPSFEATEEGFTDSPTEPNTATIGGNGTSGPADGAWLLVVALGVLLASVVVMTPARAKSRR